MDQETVRRLEQALDGALADIREASTDDFRRLKCGEYQMSLPKIRPCRCGHQPELGETFSNIDGYFRRRYYVYCTHCGKESIRMETRTKAIKTWNYGIMEEAAL